MILKRGNVERIVNNEAAIAKLKKEGFVEVEKRAQTPAEKEAVDIASMKVDDLKILAKEKGIEGYSGLTKAELMAVLKDVV